MTDQSVSERGHADPPSAEDSPAAAASVHPRKPPVSLFQRASDGCCFIVADPHLYCPERRALGSAYCAQHHAVVWRWPPRQTHASKLIEDSGVERNGVHQDGLNGRPRPSSGSLVDLVPDAPVTLAT